MLLEYKGVTFDSFSSYRVSEQDEYHDERDIKEIREDESIYAYICPRCIKEFKFYDETAMTEESIDKIIEEDDDSGMCCCVSGCLTEGAYDIDFHNEFCKLIEEQ